MVFYNIICAESYSLFVPLFLVNAVFKTMGLNYVVPKVAATVTGDFPSGGWTVIPRIGPGIGQAMNRARNRARVGPNPILLYIRVNFLMSSIFWPIWYIGLDL